ncbi:initiation control protein YabA [Eremococcus coleocola]|uniref:Initiation-control protein YabA n=1 Tax=Eremococcus coleocola ACS-139-V-Col8 TaxID=908337 RepID=E4KR09_9LACT|nr:initiation control protein YabA [Eremococcus coleocola]EFR30657.1 hypothetical protein HMPREF9257_0721 [Eremococcus coleocola ACS-139-V-Col8]
MDNQVIINLLDEAENDLIRLNDKVAQLRKAIDDLNAENNQLRMRNHALNDQLIEAKQNDLNPEQNNQELADLSVGDTQPAAPAINGKARLQSFYDEGIHICHLYFGSPRHSDESCIFCQTVLDSLEEQ